LAAVQKVVMSDKSGREVKVNTSPCPLSTIRNNFVFGTERKLTQYAELFRECATIRHPDHPWLLLHGRVATLSHRFLDFAMSQPQSHRHHEHLIRDLSSCAIRHLTRDTCRGTEISATNTAATIPRNTLATYLVGPARKSLDEQFCHLCTGYDGYLDARVLLGSK
jgi:hypothetical protein